MYTVISRSVTSLWSQWSSLWVLFGTSLRGFFNELIYLFVAVLGLHFERVGSSLLRADLLWLQGAGSALRWVSGGGSLVAVQGVSLRGLLSLWGTSSRVQAQYLWCLSLVAPSNVGFSWTRDQTHVLCIGRWIPNHWATREVLTKNFETIQKSEHQRQHFSMVSKQLKIPVSAYSHRNSVQRNAYLLSVS